MNPVILVTSCRGDVEKGRQQAQRDTCFSSSAMPYRFLLGQGNTKHNEDELVLDVPDDYDSLFLKVREGFRWALENGYDYIFKCTTDVYCFTDRLLKSGFEQFDYSGRFVDNTQADWRLLVEQHKTFDLNGNHIWASGFGCWFSKRAAQQLVTAETRTQTPEWFYDDWYTGTILAESGIQGTQDYRYHPGPYDACARLCYKETEPFLNDLCAIHLGESTDVYDKARMYAIHNGASVYELVD
jgi:hypothetical protein